MKPQETPAIFGSKRDLGKALKQMNNPFPDNPMLIHKIQDKINELPDVILAYGVLKELPTIDKRIMFIKQMLSNGRQVAIELFGYELIEMIEEYMESEKEMNVDDLPSDLFVGYGAENRDRPETECGNWI